MAPKKSRLSAEERRRRTLDRVTRVFARKGFAGTTSAELAKASGVSEALLYKLFGSKRRLYRAMIEHKLAANAGWGELPLEAAESDHAFFTTLARAIFAKVAADPAFVRLFYYSELQDPAFSKLFHEVRGRHVLEAVTEYLRARIASGELRPVDPGVAAFGFLLQVWQYAVSSKVFTGKHAPGADDDQVIETLVSIFVKGLQR